MSGCINWILRVDGFIYIMADDIYYARVDQKQGFWRVSQLYDQSLPDNEEMWKDWGLCWADLADRKNEPGYVEIPGFAWVAVSLHETEAEAVQIAIETARNLYKLVNGPN